MTNPGGFQSARPLPGGLKLIGTLAIALHFLALGTMVVNVPSGPWYVPQIGGMSPGLPPQFASALGDLARRYYLEPLSLANSYHFASNQAPTPTVVLKAQLFDDKNQPMMSLDLPDPNANAWVRQQQTLFAQVFAGDSPLQYDPGPNVKIFPVGQSPRKVTFWLPLPEGPKQVQLSQTEEQFLRFAGQQGLQAPSPRSLILGQSYIRFLKRSYGAVRVDLVRSSREPVSPILILANNPRDPKMMVLDNPAPPLRYWETLNSGFGNGEPAFWDKPKLDMESR